MKIHFGNTMNFWAMCGAELIPGRDGVADFQLPEDLKRVTCSQCKKLVQKDKRETWDANTSVTPAEEKKPQP